MLSYEKRLRFADRLSRAIGIILILTMLFVVSLQTTLLSIVPFPQSLHFESDYENFISCFEEHAKLAKTDGVTSYHKDITKPENRNRLAQVRGFLGPTESRVIYVDFDEEGFRIVDGFYEKRNAKSKPVRKYDWFIIWFCGSGNL